MSNKHFPDVEKVKELIKVLNASVKFYRDAQLSVNDRFLIVAFEEVALSHEKCVDRLQNFVLIEDGEYESGTDWAVRVREMYTSLAASVKSDTDLTYVSQLEEVEDKLLEACDDALRSEQPLHAITALNEVRVELRICHDKIRQLQFQKERRAAHS